MMRPGAARRFLGLPAPAKLNLFLHVTGRRADGYHELQTAFVPIDLADTVDLVARADPRITRAGDVVGDPSADLAVRAAHALQQAAGTLQGVDITVAKRIPAGSGLGGGSSDAATTLIGLNRLWRLDWPRQRLAQLAVALGADVAFFLQPGPAFAVGVGEVLSALSLPPLWFVVIHPQVHVSTAEVFAGLALTRNPNRTTIAGFSAAGWTSICEAGVAEPAARAGVAEPAAPLGAMRLSGENDLQHVACARAPAVGRALAALDAACGSPVARMTGSGSAVFATFSNEAGAQAVAQEVTRQVADSASGWSIWVAQGLAEHPLAPWL
jgi:4-diphosphocytidyl-2-C-methyl-D-erythritol kinase